MALDPTEVYQVMECAYRNGVLQKFMVIQGKALEAVMEEANVNMGDLLNRLDEAEEETVMKVDRLLDRLGFLMKYADNDGLMRLASRLLDIPLVRRLIISNMSANIIKTMTGQPPPSLAARIKAFSGKTA